jgi:hypothetical protein
VPELERGFPLVAVRLEHEHFDGHVRVDVVVAHEGDHLAVELVLDQADEVVAHHRLIVVAQLEDPRGLSGLDQPALPPREDVGQQDHHRVVVDDGPGLGRPAAGVVVRDHEKGEETMEPRKQLRPRVAAGPVGG